LNRQFERAEKIQSALIIPDYELNRKGSANFSRSLMRQRFATIISDQVDMLHCNIKADAVKSGRIAGRVMSNYLYQERLTSRNAAKALGLLSLSLRLGVIARE